MQLRLLARHRMFFEAKVALCVAASVASSACIGGSSGSTSKSATNGATCSAPTGTAWTPTISGAGSANHDGAVTRTTQTFNVTGGRVTAIDQSFTAASAIFTVEFDVATAFVGSLSLQAEATGLHSTLKNSGGYGWPVLIELTNDNATVGQDWVKMAAACKNSGLFTGGSYTYKAGCEIGAGSAYLGSTAALRTESWEMGSSTGYSGEEYSQAVFPTCSWTAGDTPSCPFVAGGFLDAAGKVPAGRYTAKYVVLTNFLTSTLGAGHSYTSNLKVTVTQKEQAAGAGAKAIDLNVILVGSENVNQSRTERGKQNLNLLFEGLQSLFSSGSNASTLNVKLGTVTVYEWGCSTGGDSYASLSTGSLATFLKTGSALVASSSSGSAINVFLVSRITSGSSGGLTVLGVAGGIPGALVHGTASSGLVFSTFDNLSSYNSGCAIGGACPTSSQSSSFVDMQATVAHELGHYLGLRHISEKAGTKHDPVPETPECTAVGGSGYITQTSCYGQAACGTPCATEAGAGGYNGTTRFCPTTSQCEFNHLMFWLSKNYKTGDPSVSDGNMVTGQAASIMRSNPYVY